MPYHLSGAAAFFQRAEVRDLLAWLRLLVDPGDAGAVVRALARPPVELRAIDLARVTQIARRRKLDMVAALERRAGVAADPARGARADRHLPQALPLRRRARWTPRARTCTCTGWSSGSGCAGSCCSRPRPRSSSGCATSRASPSWRPRTCGARRRPRRASSPARSRPSPTPGLREEEAAGAEARPRRARDDDARRQGPRVRARLRARPDERADARPAAADARADPGRADQGDRPAAVARGARRRDAAAAARGDDARARSGSCSPTPSGPTAARCSSRRRSPRRRGRRSAGEWEPREEELFGPAETLQSTFRLLRDELLTTVAQVGGRLGELRFDTDLDVSHAVVRYLELIKLERAAGAHALGRAVGGGGAAGDQRAAAAGLDLRAARDLRDVARWTTTCSTPSATSGCARGRWRRATSRRWSRSCPRRGDGLLLSATDIETYRTCPLKYKFARVFRIPSEPTMNQRFGILVHQVLERYHGGSADAGPAGAARAAGGRLAARRLRRLRGGAPVPRQGDAGAGPLPRPLQGGGGRAGLVRARLPVPARPAPAARARGPRRPAPGRRLRADRLQDRPPEDRRPAARGRPALAVRGRRARVVGARGRLAVLLLRARRREGARSSAPTRTATGSPRP